MRAPVGSNPTRRPFLHRRTTLVAVFVAAIGLMAAAAWLNWHQFGKVLETEAWVARTHRIQAELNRLLVLAVDIETGARGFVVTGDPVFLEPFESGVPQIGEVQRHLAEELLGDDQQRANLETLRPMITANILRTHRLLELRRSGGFEPARQHIVSGQGKAMMDAIRVELAKMRARGDELLAARAATASREARFTRRWVTISTALSAMLLIAVMALLLRENRLRLEANTFLDSVIENIPNMVFVKDATDLRFVRFNRAGEEMLGRDRDELVGRNDYDFFPPTEADFFTAKDRQVLASGQPLEIPREEIERGDGEKRTLRTKKIPIHDAEGNPQYLLGISEDITERQQAQEAIIALNADLTARASELAEVNRELESFSYSVSHDLRAPLRHIQGYATLLTKATDGELPETAKRYVETIVGSSIEMGRLIDGLLALSRIGRSKLESRPVNLEKLVASVVQALEPETRNRNVQWTVGSLPTVAGDPTLLKQVFANLVGNAVKYSAPREAAEIEIGCGADEDGKAVLYVRDNGVGFDMRYADKLFGVFQRLHRADEFEGTGIGLATVRRIVSRHGGRIWAEGRPDEGATFYFSLPRAS